ncbi:MAG: ARPP-1 family domain-containing protein [Planctomycetota bacterium]|jgi:hypothetical protein
MISDELRELLSAYVDGELPHADAKRVEDTAKRDPRLRRHIQAYRRLSDTLRVWDVEEHGLEPSDSVRDTALARVRAFQARKQAEQKARPAWYQQRWMSSPLAAAAGLLLAVGVGVVMSMSNESTERVEFALRGDAVKSDPIAPYGDFAATLKSEPLPAVASTSEAWPAGTIEDIIRHGTEGVMIATGDGFVRWSRRALEADRFIRNIENELDPGNRGYREPITGPLRNPVVASMLKGYELGRTPYSVLSVQLGGGAGNLPNTRAAPARTEKASGSVEGGELGPMHDIRVTDGGAAVITLLGELWVEPEGDSDRFRRVRVVTGTSWVKKGELVPMAWANGTAADPLAKHQWALRAESFILGPKARKALVGKQGKDVELLAWLTNAYGAKGGVVAAARADARKRKPMLDKMVRALQGDDKATGFAVYDSDGKLLGTELFATHKLMVDFAPRLLCGYLLEAGDRIRLDAGAGGAVKIEAMARKFLDDTLPQNVGRIADTRTAKDAADWPQGMRQVNLQTPTREVVGHGLMIGEHPIHLTLFGE